MPNQFGVIACGEMANSSPGTNHPIFYKRGKGEGGGTNEHHANTNTEHRIHTENHQSPSSLGLSCLSLMPNRCNCHRCSTTFSLYVRRVCALYDCMSLGSHFHWRAYCRAGVFCRLMITGVCVFDTISPYAAAQRTTNDPQRRNETHISA